MVGLPASIIKKYGVSKKAWRIFRSARKKARSNPDGRGKVMARRRRSYRPVRYRGKKQGWGIPSLASLAPLGVVGASMVGVPGLGINVIEPIQRGDFGGAIGAAGNNLVYLMTGYDMKARQFAPMGAAAFYGSILIPRLLRRLVGRVRAGPINIL